MATRRTYRHWCAAAAAAALCAAVGVSATPPFEMVRTLNTSMVDVIPGGGGCKHYIMTLPSSTAFSVAVTTSSTASNSLVIMLGAPPTSCAAYNTVRASTSGGRKTVYVSSSDTFYTGLGQEYHMFVQAAVGMSFTFTITSLPNMPAVQFMAMGTYTYGSLATDECSMYAFMLPPSAGFQVSLVAHSGDPDLVLGVAPPTGQCALVPVASSAIAGSDYLAISSEASYFRGEGQTIFVRVRAFTDTSFSLSVNNLSPSPSPAPGSSSTSSGDSGAGASGAMGRIGGIAGGIAVMMLVAGIALFFMRARARVRARPLDAAPLDAAAGASAAGNTAGGSGGAVMVGTSPKYPISAGDPSVPVSPGAPVPAPVVVLAGGPMLPPPPAPPATYGGYGYGYGGASAPNSAAPYPYPVAAQQPAPYPYSFMPPPPAAAAMPTPYGSQYPTMPGAPPGPMAPAYTTHYPATMPPATDGYPPPGSYPPPAPVRSVAML